MSVSLSIGGRATQRLHRGPGEAEADPAAAGALAARAQVPAQGVAAAERRDVAMHPAPLQDHEGRPQPYDVLSGWYSTCLFQSDLD